MNWSNTAIVLTLWCCSVTAAADPQPPSEYGKLYKVWKAEVQSLKEVMPPFTPQEIATRKREINARFTPQFLKLAQRHDQLSDDRLWLNCLIWMSVEGVSGPDFDAMFDLLGEQAETLEEHHWIQLTLLMSQFIRLDSGQINPALEKVHDSHPSPLVRGAALYALAARVKSQAEFQGDLAGCRRAEKLLEKVIAEYPEVHTYSGENRENARQLLDELHSPVAISQPAPEITGTLLDGMPFRLADHQGRVVLLAFSGHWCGPCVSMHPTLRQLVEKHGDRLTVLELNSDALEKLDRVKQKVEADGLNWRILPEGNEGPQAATWKVSVWPTFYVLDRQHHIRYRATGNRKEELSERVNTLIAEEQQP